MLKSRPRRPTRVCAKNTGPRDVSFTAAATALAMSKSAVSKHVSRLEDRLGARLLNRTTRAVSVTEPGQRFLAGARRVLTDLAEIEGRSNLRPGLWGLLTLGLILAAGLALTLFWRAQKVAADVDTTDSVSLASGAMLSLASTSTSTTSRRSGGDWAPRVPAKRAKRARAGAQIVRNKAGSRLSLRSPRTRDGEIKIGRAHV